MTERSQTGDAPAFEPMALLEPTPAQRRAMRGRVLDAFEADHTSLLAEWIDLLRVRPFRHGAWLLAASIVLVAELAPLVPWDAVP